MTVWLCAVTVAVCMTVVALAVSARVRVRVVVAAVVVPATTSWSVVQLVLTTVEPVRVVVVIACVASTQRSINQSVNQSINQSSIGLLQLVTNARFKNYSSNYLLLVYSLVSISGRLSSQMSIFAAILPSKLVNCCNLAKFGDRNLIYKILFTDHRTLFPVFIDRGLCLVLLEVPAI